MQRNVFQDNEQALLEKEDMDLDAGIHEKKVKAEKMREEKKEDPKQFKDRIKLEKLNDEISDLVEL